MTLMDDGALRQKLLAEIARLQQQLGQTDAGAETTLMQRNYMAFVDAIPHPAWVNDPAGKVLYFNQRWAQYTGLSARPTATEWIEAFHEEDRARLVALREAAVANGREYGIELPMKRGIDNTFRWHRCKVAPLRADDGHIFGWLGTSMDIDDLRRTQSRLSEEEARFKAIAETIPQMVWTANPDGRTDYYNPRALAYTGMTMEELCGECWADSVHPDDLARLLPVWQESMKTGCSYEIEARVRRYDGVYRTFALKAMPMRDDAGRIIKWFGTSTDVEDERRAQAAVRESGERLQAALNAAGTGTFRWDIRTNALEWDENLDRLFGLQPGQTARSLPAFITLVHPDDRAGVIERCERCAAEGCDFSMTFRVVWPDGSTHWLFDQGKSFSDQTGRPAYMTGACVDVTAQKEVEAELQRARTAAERAGEAKDRFIAVLSHELRTPLTPALLAITSLDREPALSAEAREQLKLLRRNIDLETHLIDDLLDITRITSGKLRLANASVSLHEVIEDAWAICDPEAREKGVTVEKHLLAAHHHVTGDRARLVQVLWNLVKNAIKFTPAGGTVTVQTQDAPDGSLHLLIRDTGIGMDPAVLPRIFNAFEQGEQTVTREFGGLGLGLTICRAIVELHGGNICADSRGRGMGSTFHVVLPGELRTSPAPDAAPRRRAPAQPITLAGLRVLLVDDHPDTLRMTALLLKQFGMKVTTCSSPATAIEAIEQSAFDIVLSDIGMPEVPGTELLQMIRRVSSAPAIALSGFGMETDIKKSLAAGFAAHLTKPIDLDHLLRVIEEVVNAVSAA